MGLNDCGGCGAWKAAVGELSLLVSTLVKQYADQQLELIELRARVNAQGEIIERRLLPRREVA